MIKGSDIQVKMVVVKGMIQFQAYYNGQLVATAWSESGVKSQALIKLNKGV